MPLCRELSRALVIGEIIALKCDGGWGLLRHGVAQMLCHFRNIRKQLLLLRREPVRTLLTPLVLDEIQMLKARVRVPSIGSMGRHRECGTGDGQCE
jgi:hypothetical protein